MSDVSSSTTERLRYNLRGVVQDNTIDNVLPTAWHHVWLVMTGTMRSAVVDIYDSVENGIWEELE